MIIYKNIVGILDSSIPTKKLFIKVRYFIKFKRRINLSKEPTTFSEKIQHRKLYDQHPLYPVCADKYKVRQYVEQVIGKEYLIPLLSNTTKLEYEYLKNLKMPYIIKNNHDSGNVFIIKEDDEKLQEAIKKANAIMKLNQGKWTGETWYSKIERSIIIEELLQDEEKKVPIDIKVHAFKGTTKKVITVDFNRFTDKHSRKVFDEQGNELDMEYYYKNDQTKMDTPVWLNEVIKLADKLRDPFDYARVDFYYINQQIYFGELTFAPSSGYVKFNDKKWDRYMGSLWTQEITK
jgi:hypothetical protein